MGKNLNEMTPDELREYADKLEKENNKPPVAIYKPDFSKLIETAKQVVTDYATLGYSKDARQYIYEEAMIAIFGEKIFEWINKVDREW